ncbi:MAG: MBL fold metallo-hydrolase [Chloroflexota bacterium]|nr:MBL fold metallo-hydrolase [Chloroflexota bacterium]
MLAKLIVPGLYGVATGPVNVFLLDTDDGLTLIDTGVAGSGEKILQAVRDLGKRPDDIRHILITHAHPDHVGGLAEIKQATGVPVYAHPFDIGLIEAGDASRPLTPTPALLQRILFRLVIQGSPSTFPAASVEQAVQDSDELPIAGGLRAIHAPGHSAGQLAFFWPQHGGVLFAADSCANLPVLGYSLGYEDFAEGKRTLAKLATLDFQVACFGHGNAITQGAADRFRRKWGKQ